MAEDLRLEAEKLWNTKKKSLPLIRTGQDAERLVHELAVHKIELEMQNDELLRIQKINDLSLIMYRELFESAPVAYFIFDESGVTQEVNHAGIEILGIEKQLSGPVPFTSFILNNGEKDVFINHLKLTLQRKVLLKCYIKLKDSYGNLIHGQLQSIAINSGNRDGHVLTSIVDGTVRKQFEEKLQKAHNELEVLVLARTAELSMANIQLKMEIDERKGAEELLQSSFAEIKALKDRLHEENIYLQRVVDRQFNFGEIVGQSPVLTQVFSQIEQVASMNATVLLLGETGTGKGVVARAIHSRSARKGRPLITVDCTTLPATLVESELFGRERGAFTGSDTRQVGRFELADGGTIFLDEIGEMPLELQSKLLRVIQDGEFERLGNPRTIKTDVRIIAATNRDLKEEIKNGKFRADLFYRLNVFPITVPPLRERKEDIPLLVNHFVAKFNLKIGKKIESVSEDTLHTLQEYYWPGNVRDLESVVERAVITSQGSSLQILERFDSSRHDDDPGGKEIKALVDLEHDHILQVLRKTSWRIEGKNGAAILLGLNASTLRARMRKYGIVRT